VRSYNPTTVRDKTARGVFDRKNVVKYWRRPGSGEMSGDNACGEETMESVRLADGQGSSREAYLRCNISLAKSGS
jgi:hypothetical protein